jgi:hypothetical protein
MDQVFVNIWNGHFKVWCCELKEGGNGGQHQLTTYWGAIGKPKSKLQSATKSFYSWYAATAEKEKKVSEKLYSKGYTTFPAERYWQLISGGDTNRILSEILDPVAARTKAQPVPQPIQKPPPSNMIRRAITINRSPPREKQP